MSNPTPPTPPQGPFTSKSTRTYELSNIKLVVTDSLEGSHVPQPCGCGGGGITSDLVNAVLAKLAPFLGGTAQPPSDPHEH